MCALCLSLPVVPPSSSYQTEFEQPNKHQQTQPESEHPDPSHDASEPHEQENAYETEEEHPGYQPNVYTH